MEPPTIIVIIIEQYFAGGGVSVGTDMLTRKEMLTPCKVNARGDRRRGGLGRGRCSRGEAGTY